MWLFSSRRIARGRIVKGAVTTTSTPKTFDLSEIQVSLPPAPVSTVSGALRWMPTFVISVSYLFKDLFASTTFGDSVFGPKTCQLSLAKVDFAKALEGIDNVATIELLVKINMARSPRQLWYLRTAVYNEFCLKHSEAKGVEMMKDIDKHFPRGTVGKM